MTINPNHFELSPEAERVKQLLKKCPTLELPKYGERPIVTGDAAPAMRALEAYKNLRTRLLRTQENLGVRSVIITSSTHAEGKTLTSFNLAYCCAQLENNPVLLIDADLRTHGLTKLVGADDYFGLRDVLADAVPYEKAIVATESPNLYVMGAGRGDAAPAELFATSAWTNFLTWAGETFRMVLVDAPPVGVVADMSLIEAACQGTLVIVRAHRTTQHSLEEAFGQIDSKKVLGVVWNQAKQRPEYYPYYYYSSPAAASKG